MNGKRTFALIAILMMALVTIPQFEASPGGIGSNANDGCLCHTQSSATVISIDGLPETFNASEEYTFTLSITNDEVVGASGGFDRAGGFRIWVEDSVGTLEAVPDEQGNVGHEIEGALTHNDDVNNV